MLPSSPVGTREYLARIREVLARFAKGELSIEEALRGIDVDLLRAQLRPSLAPSAALQSLGHEELARGLPASAGVVSGEAYFDTQRAIGRAEAGYCVLLVRRDVGAEELEALRATAGSLTSSGGLTSHGAIMARGLSKPCIVGCSSMHVDERKGTAAFRADGAQETIREGDTITIDGATGRVFRGRVDAEPAATFPELSALVRSAKTITPLQIEAAPTGVDDARAALAYGADAIGLVRSDLALMSRGAGGLLADLAVAETVDECNTVFAGIETATRTLLSELLALSASSIGFRLLDASAEWIAQSRPANSRPSLLPGLSDEARHSRVQQRQSKNPALGLRGIRYAFMHDGLYEAQLRGVAAALREHQNAATHVRVIIPLVTFESEIKKMRACFDAIMTDDRATLAVMMETPAACLAAAKIAVHAHAFYFGTNDLTQFTLGATRDADQAWVHQYVRDGLLSADPFAELHESVAELVEYAVLEGRKAAPNLFVSLCGEPASSKSAFAIAAKLGLNAVCTAPEHVALARLRAARTGLVG